MNILITGGAGFIGSTLAKKLESDNNIVIIDNFNDFYDPKLKEKNFKELSNSKLYKGDIRDSKLMGKIFKENNIEMVVHIAGMAGVRPSIDNPVLYNDVNVLGTAVILEAMKEYGCNKLVMASSSSVYGNNDKTPFSEEDVVDFPISPYAANKKANEVQTHVYHKIYDFDVFMLRFFTVYGPKQRPDLAINKFMTLINNEQPIDKFGDGTSRRDYTFIDDIISGVVKSMNYVKENKNVYEVLNIGNGTPVTLNELICECEKVVGKKAIINQMPMQPGDVTQTISDPSKIRKLLNWEAKTTFESGMKKYYDWKKNR